MSNQISDILPNLLEWKLPHFDKILVAGEVRINDHTETVETKEILSLLKNTKVFYALIQTFEKNWHLLFCGLPEIE